MRGYVQFNKYTHTHNQVISGHLEETAAGEDNRIIRQRRVRDNEVLLRRLQRLHEGIVGVVQYLEAFVPCGRATTEEENSVGGNKNGEEENGDDGTYNWGGGRKYIPPLP